MTLAFGHIQALLTGYFSNKPVSRVYLFGSFARGDEHAASDIDVLVELDYHRGGGDFYKFLEMKEDLEHILQRKVDLVSAKGLSTHIAQFVETDKKLVYEREA